MPETLLSTSKTANVKSKPGVMLLRHAHAAWPNPGEKDFDRKLDDVGRQEAVAVAEHLQQIGVVPDLILCSPATRCRETLALATEFWENQPQTDFDIELYSGGLPTYIDRIEKHAADKTILIVGHNPMIEDIFLWLADNDCHGFAGYATASLAVFGAQEHGKWKLAGLHLPG